MNSIQLISKINSRIEDLAMLSQEILKPNSELSNIEKEVIKRNCSELFELVLKLKTSNDLSEAQIALKENLSQEIRNNETTFKDVISNNIQANISINAIAESKEPEDIFEEEVSFEISTENLKNNAEIIADIKEIFDEPVSIETTPIIDSIPEIEVIEIPIDLTPVFTEELPKISEEKLNTNIEIIVNETILTETVISPEIPVFENNEPEEKPASFFSIGKTVMPKTEPTLNEKIAQKLDGFQLSEKVIEPKIDNLKTAISLNKKIAFVNELFKENVVDYAKSIDKINSSTDLNEALLFWTELKINHNWNNENALVKDLEKLIHRRFS